MLGEDFDKWPVTSVANDILISLGIHVFSIEYLKDGSSWFVKLPDGGTVESKKLLVVLVKQPLLKDNKQLPTVDDSDVEQIRKKEATSEKQRTRKNTLVNPFAITTTDAFRSGDADVSRSADASTFSFAGTDTSTSRFSAGASPSVSASASWITSAGASRPAATGASLSARAASASPSAGANVSLFLRAANASSFTGNISSLLFSSPPSRIT